MKIEFIDIHAHLNFAAYDNDREAVISDLKDKNIAVINVGTQADTSSCAVKLADRYENLYAAIGLHPIHTSKSFHDEKELGSGNREFTSRGEIFDLNNYLNLGQSKKVVAIGECGLDYFRLDENSKAKQEVAFLAQIELANNLGKPLMLHVRQAYSDALAILRKNAKVNGNFHFFAGTWEEAKMILDYGFNLSFTGVLTFTSDYDEVVKNTPIERIMSETDSPYVTPVPHRGKRNDPSKVVYVVKRIAEIKNLPLEQVKKQLLINARNFFRLEDLSLD
jgi:TatD DNase family protein